MVFDASFENVRLIGQYLTVRYRGKDIALDLDRCLSAVNGKFQWGGQGGFSAARKHSLVNGSELRGEVKYNNRWYQDQIDLSTNIQLRNGQLAYVASFSSKRIISDASYSSYSKRSSSYLEFSIGNTLTLRGSILHAKGRKSGETHHTFDLELDLNSYIGVVDGRLIWGRTGFFSDCKNVRLEGFILHADCANGNSTLDLSRYLQIYNGKLDVKVTEKTGEEMIDLFSEARWLKFKVITELDSAEAVKVLEEKAAFRGAFNALAETTSLYVQAEMEEFSTSASEYIKKGMEDQVKANTTTLISDALAAKVQGDLTDKVKETFAAARRAIEEACNAAETAVLDSCKEMMEVAAGDVAVKFEESVIGPMREKIVAECDRYTKETLEEVRASAIAHFQERAEIMMERQIISASIRRAQTKARILEMFMQGEFV
ncbi:hypothetical protein BDP27DRAFT_1408126 [Rhodocollybia butyracea]|uniref:Cyanovirin-N domain-containing protein n=1 Tax=Rhodocollybia butyracea TaxID=206335 RepID=A0A9P5P7H5_9AGAR|nr:hypothetical protein BDP27DRAFT_1408126 [Rhodocollybia butyracea]